MALPAKSTGSSGQGSEQRSGLGRFASTSLVVTAISFGARGVGFLVPFFVAAWFGATGSTDVLFFVYALALFVSNVLAPVLENLSVPFIAQRRGRGDNAATFVGWLAIIAVAGASVTSALLASGSLFLLPRLTAFSAANLALASRLLIGVTPLIALTAVSSVFAGALNAEGRFYFTAASPFVRAVVNLLVIWSLKASLGVSAVILGYVAGEAARLVALFCVCAWLRLVALPRRFAEVSRDVIEFLRVGGFQAAGMLSIGFVPLIDRTMASWLGVGSVSLLEYSDRIYQIPVALLGTGLVVTSLSRWSALLHDKGKPALRADVATVVVQVSKLTLMVSGLMAIASPILVRVVYHKALSATGTRIVVTTVIAYLLGVAPFVIGQLYNRALLALKQTRFLLAVTVIANVLNAAFNLLMMRLFGVAGLALSSSATALAVVFVLRYRFLLMTRAEAPVAVLESAVSEAQ